MKYTAIRKRVYGPVGRPWSLKVREKTGANKRGGRQLRRLPMRHTPTTLFRAGGGAQVRKVAPWRLLALLLCCLLGGTLGAQQDTTALSRMLRYHLRATVGLQVWTTFSTGMAVYDAERGAYTPVDNRLNTSLRRSRYTISGQPYKTIDFQLITALDAVGRDVLSSTDAGSAAPTTPALRLWNLFLKWRVVPDSDAAYLAAGYFLPPLGRESGTAALRSTTFEKAWSQNYLRRHLTGVGQGRATGLLFGGQWHADDDQGHLTYEVSQQHPSFNLLGGNSAGRQANPLVSSRLSLSLGDPENEAYSLIHRVNYFGKRQGITLSVAAARQGRTDLFRENLAAGFELLANYPAIHVDGDVYVLQRTAQSGTTTGATGYLRAGRNFPLPRQLVLEPVVSYWFFRGHTGTAESAFATRIGAFSGRDSGLDLGANLYFNPDLKLLLFYVRRQGSAGDGDPVTLINNFFQQGGVGAIERGNYVGMGVVAIL